MYHHINMLTKKYMIETVLWNSVNQNMPTDIHQSYRHAEKFLKIKGFTLLLKNGIDVLSELTTEEKAYIESTITEWYIS